MSLLIVVVVVVCLCLLSSSSSSTSSLLCWFICWSCIVLFVYGLYCCYCSRLVDCGLFILCVWCVVIIFVSARESMHKKAFVCVCCSGAHASMHTSPEKSAGPTAASCVVLCIWTWDLRPFFPHAISLTGKLIGAGSGRVYSGRYWQPPRSLRFHLRPSDWKLCELKLPV